MSALWSSLSCLGTGKPGHPGFPPYLQPHLAALQIHTSSGVTFYPFQDLRKASLPLHSCFSFILFFIYSILQIFSETGRSGKKCLHYFATYMKRGNSAEAKHVQVTRVLQEPQALSTLSKSTGVPVSLCMLPLDGHGWPGGCSSLFWSHSRQPGANNKAADSAGPISPPDGLQEKHAQTKHLLTTADGEIMGPDRGL